MASKWTKWQVQKDAVLNGYTKGKGKDAASDAEAVDSMLMDLDNDNDACGRKRSEMTSLPERSSCDFILSLQ